MKINCPNCSKQFILKGLIDPESTRHVSIRCDNCGQGFDFSRRPWLGWRFLKAKMRQNDNNGK